MNINDLKQGDIINIDFNPVAGHEQAGYRPAVIISNDTYNKKTKLHIVCPITHTNNKFPLHIELDNRTKTGGFILCEHIRTLDLETRKFVYYESLPSDLLKKVIELIKLQFEIE